MSYFEKTKITNSSGTVINPAQDESILLLRKIVKLLEASATIDLKQRQKVVVEAIGTNNATPTEVNAAIPVTGTVSANSTAVASTVNMGQVVVGFGGQATAAANIIDSRYFLVDTSRNAYANGIRKNLSWG